ncbi:pyridoxine 5'-phosphate synthase [Ponticaulis sp.]|uniref:pyridoxine 5'-phosphate synthase n=1 Tax=Ponticaulis sp. TaxID=2020902 RepID=UPI000B75DFF8|nr:pyridoxine 5'-phosphate synthase [Ponticaulis sp.]MAI89675.1 pyridoxine 5'-phosphate synthase [Ponticaulis sp.]OUY00695.1 MAG: pyridoxine 5'-phosphate synthase [Hyphomonadaceae bacterium TMED5]|tara:strand:+ start:113544 stop:114287 length:744 start_codon:yes stop_codon:yes gene_type:complete
MADRIRLGVNIDHVATIRNARGGLHPDPFRAAEIVSRAGGDGLTIHLREDRRHIRDEDLQRVREASSLPINLEMAAVEEMLDIALAFKPETAMFVPEKREERTTEGGLDVARQHNLLAPFVRQLVENGSKVSLFIEPDMVQLAAAKQIGASVTEFHTGRFVELCMAGEGVLAGEELERIKACAERAVELGIEPQAGHGLTYDTVMPIAEIPELTELNIGHFIIGEAVFVGLEAAIREMRRLMDEARA